MNDAQTLVLDSWGWGLQDSLWCYDAASDTEQRLYPTGGGLFSFRGGVADRFLIVEDDPPSEGHHVSVRRLDAVDIALAAARHTGSAWVFDGDQSAWEGLPRYLRVWRGDQSYGLLHLHPDDPDIDPLAWYTDDAYDRDYQGILDPYEVPNSHLLIISVQRDSRPVLYDPNERLVVGHLVLADRHGNPTLRFRTTADELWVDDYDTLLRLRPQSWEILDAIRLQEADATPPFARQFIGDWSFSSDEQTCVVFRPFEGDAVLLDTSGFEPQRRIRLQEQPLDGVLLDNGVVIARDWMSRRLVRGHRDDAVPF